MTPLLLALAREPRPLHRFLLGYSAGVVYWFCVCNWIQFVLEVHGGMGRWGGWGTFLLFCLAKAVHLGVFSLTAAIVLRHWFAIPAIAALWTGIERTHGNLGFAWLCLGNAGIDMGLPMRLAPWIGVYGLSFLFATMAAATALVLLRRGRKELLWLAWIPALLLLPGLPDAARGSQAAVMVQPNMPEEQEWTGTLERQLHQQLVTASLEQALIAKPRLIIWPEVPGPIYYFRDYALREKVALLARTTHSYLIFGTVADHAQGRAAEFGCDPDARRRTGGALRQDQPGALRRVRAAILRLRESHHAGGRRFRSRHAPGCLSDRRSQSGSRSRVRGM